MDLAKQIQDFIIVVPPLHIGGAEGNKNENDTEQGSIEVGHTTPEFFQSFLTGCMLIMKSIVYIQFLVWTMLIKIVQVAVLVAINKLPNS